MMSRLARKLAALAMAAALAAGLAAGCDTIQSSFPPLESTQPSGTQTNPSESSQPSETTGRIELTAALPMDEETLDAVRLLYLAKKSGKLSQEPGQYIGQQVDVEDLRQFESDFQVELEPVPLSTGATLLEVSTWEAAAMLPDIIYCQDAIYSLGLNQVIVLDDLLFDDPLLSAAHLYTPLLESGRIGGKLFCIPYLASTPVIYLNQNIMNQYQITAPEREWTWQDWQDFCKAAQEAMKPASVEAMADAVAMLKDEDPANDETAIAQLSQTLFVIDNPAGCLPFMPASIAQSAGYAMWDGEKFQFGDASFKTAVRSLAEYQATGCSPNLLEKDIMDAVVGQAGLNAMKREGRILMWAGDSADLSYWQKQLPFAVSASLMPSGMLNGAVSDSQGNEDPLSKRLPVTVRSLFISDMCKIPDTAAAFAAFVALDADALLLQGRYQKYEGLVPVIRDRVVWDALVGGQIQGNWLLSVRQKMPYAYCSGQQKITRWQEIMSAIQEDVGPRLLKATNNEEVAALIDELVVKAR